MLEDNKVDLLFGLDNLKRHQCCIDLVESRLHFNRGEFSVPFLSDGQIKKNKMEDAKDLLLEKQASSGGPSEEVVKELCEMGFTRPQVMEALRVSDGNQEQAANFLL